MLTNKIINLINQLDEECKKEKVIISLTVFDEKGEAKLVQSNNKIGALVAVGEQIKQLEQLSNWDCENCQKKSNDDTPKHKFHVNSAEDLADVLDRIAKGEFD